MTKTTGKADQYLQKAIFLNQLSMGIYLLLIVIPGLVSAVMPSLMGIFADLWDIRRGMMLLSEAAGSGDKEKN